MVRLPGLISALILVAAALNPAGRIDVQLQNRRNASDDENVIRFVTRPDLTALRWDIEILDNDALAPGYWFLAPYARLEQEEWPEWTGPMIYDINGDLVWSGAALFNNFNVYDFRVAEVDGEQMLSVISPRGLEGQNERPSNIPDGNDGAGVVVNSSYQVFETINMSGKAHAVNMHDLTLVENGSRALMITQKTFAETHIEIGSFKGPCHVGWHGFREVDLLTGKSVFEWNAKGHIDVSESSKVIDTYEAMCESQWDILHFNSVDKFADGDYLLCARHTDTIYKISHKDGSIVWRLGGRGQNTSDFVFQNSHANFSRQHHAKIYSQNETHTLISLFNNAFSNGKEAGSRSTSNHSTGLLLALDTSVTPMTVDLVSQYDHPDGKLVMARGSVNFLSNGNAFVGWSISSILSEHTFDGRLLAKASLRQNETDSYRIYKFPWVGRPARPPDAHSRASVTDRGRVSTVVHVSWNGATEVSSWNLLHTDGSGYEFETIAVSPRQGFETALVVDGLVRHVVVAAVNEKGEELGRSKCIATLTPENITELSSLEPDHWQEAHVFSPGQAGPARHYWFEYLQLSVALAAACCAVVMGCYSRNRHVREGILRWLRSVESFS